MARQLDFKSDPVTNDILIENGDFVTGDNKDFQAKVIVTASKGDLKQFPLVGAEIDVFLGSNINDIALTNYIEEKLLEAGYTLRDFDVVTDGNNYTANITVE